MGMFLNFLTSDFQHKIKQFVLKAYGQSELSPSVVYRIVGDKLETIFYDDGNLYMSGSICAKVDGVALLGSPNGNLMACYKK